MIGQWPHRLVLSDQTAYLRYQPTCCSTHRCRHVMASLLVELRHGVRRKHAKPGLFTAFEANCEEAPEHFIRTTARLMKRAGSAEWGSGACCWSLSGPKGSASRRGSPRCWDTEKWEHTAAN